jgi:hypothetical protein
MYPLARASHRQNGDAESNLPPRRYAPREGRIGGHLFKCTIARLEIEPKAASTFYGPFGVKLIGIKTRSPLTLGLCL